MNSWDIPVLIQQTCVEEVAWLPSTGDKMVIKSLLAIVSSWWFRAEVGGRGQTHQPAKGVVSQKDMHVLGTHSAWSGPQRMPLDWQIWLSWGQKDKKEWAGEGRGEGSSCLLRPERNSMGLHVEIILQCLTSLTVPDSLSCFIWRQENEFHDLLLQWSRIWPGGWIPKSVPREFPGGPVVRTLCFHGLGPQFNPWLGN